MLYQDLQGRKETLELLVLREYRVSLVLQGPVDPPGHKVNLDRLDLQDPLQGLKEVRDLSDRSDLQGLLVHRAIQAHEVL